MLDTNIVSALMRDPRGSVRSRAEAFGLNDLCVSIISAGELQFGLAKSRSPRVQSAIESILAAIAVVPLEPPVERTYGEIRAHLVRQGRIIGPNDFWIAAHALTLNVALVTANVGEFSRVPGLKIKNWLD